MYAPSLILLPEVVKTTITVGLVKLRPTLGETDTESSLFGNYMLLLRFIGRFFNDDRSYFGNQP